MLKFDAKTAQCQVYTYKEGLLSAVAHDLKIDVTSFEIQIDPEQGSIQATFDPASLRVVSAMKDGTPTPDVPSAGDKKKIEETMQNDVLHSKKHGAIRFTSSALREEGDGAEVKGELELHGTRKAIGFKVSTQDGYYVADVALHQPDYGIKPYSAMMGTLKIKADVRVVVRVPTSPPG